MLILVFNHIYGWSDYLSDPDNLSFLKQMVADKIILASLIYIAVTIVSCVVLALPGLIFAILAGFIFGPWLGTVLCSIATTIGAALAFLVGRFFLKDTLKPMISKNRYLKRILFDEADKSDIILLLITRIIPIFPYNLQNFAYGITNIRFWKYTWYSFLFMLPGVALFTIGSAGFTSGESSSLYFILAGIILIALIIVGLYLKRRHFNKNNS